MPPKVDPSEVRFSNYPIMQLTLKFLVEKPVLLLLSLLNWVPSVWYLKHYLECQKGW